MSILRLLVPALAVAGSALAQVDCSDKTINIQNPGDAQSLSSCQTIKGDVIIAPTASGDIRLDGVTQIQGDLSCDGCANVTSLAADSLTEVGGSWILNGLTAVGSLNFPAIQEVGSLNWTALGPGLSSLSFGDSGITKASVVHIENTYLTALDGINLQEVDQFEITNNNFLTKVEVQFYNITHGLILSSNGMNLSAEFPNLQWAYNMTFRNVSDVKIPSLARVNGSLGFFDGFYESLAAPNLTRLDKGSLIFADNNDLTNVSFPQLNFIGGGFTVANNTHLKSITGFPKVKTVNGAIDLSGNFTEAAFPALGVVQGAFNAQSSGDIDSSVCPAFKKQQGSGVIRGHYYCKGKEATPGRQGSSSTSSSSQPTKTAGAHHVAIRAVDVLGFSSVIAVLLHMLV